MHVLFLQGPSSFYMEQVARLLIARGHRASRINLHFGDRLFWRLPAKDYRGGIDGWRSYVSRHLDADPVTHLFLLGDQRPHHRIAIEEVGSLSLQGSGHDVRWVRGLDGKEPTIGAHGDSVRVTRISAEEFAAIPVPTSRE